MKKRLLVSMLSLALVLTGVVIPEGNVVSVQAEETTKEYSFDASLIDYNYCDEFTIGDIPYVTGELLDSDGKALDYSEWVFVDGSIIVDEGHLTYYSAYDNVEDSRKDAVTFTYDIPEAAFGKYVYEYYRVTSSSDTSKIHKEGFVRSKYTITTWADTDYCTFSLNNDGKTVSVFTLWNTDSANILSKIKVGGKTYKVTAIGDNALDNSGKTSLKSVTIPSTITYIGENAFADASKLKTITIKGNLKTVVNGAFSGINKSAVFKIKASKSNYNKIVKMIKKSGVAKTVKFKRI